MVARFLRNKKAKGTVAENYLVRKFWEKDWVCVRVAGSGSTKFPAPDILASRGDRKIVMEVKLVNSYKKYFSKSEIDDLNFFAEKFGAESWVGICFKENQWFFIPTEELRLTKGENYVIDVLVMKRKGFNFDDMVKGFL